MPLATNNILLVEQRLWTLAIAWPGLATAIAPATVPLMKPGNRIRFDQLGINWPELAKSRRNVADSVEFELDVPFNGQPDSRQWRTFCIQGNVNTFDYVWRLSAATHQITDITQAFSELQACMLAAGTQLGIPTIVARWEQQFRPGKPQDIKDRQILWIQRVTIKS